MKKYSRVVLVAMMTLVLAGALALVGCSSPSSGNQQTTNSSSQETQQAEKVELQIFAANSLTKALAEVEALYMEDNEDIRFADTQYKASGELVTMLTDGSSADILITASKGTMDTAETAALIDPETRFDMFTNDLVIVAKQGSGIANVTLQDIADGTYTVAIGDESVPAGNYASQALTTVGAYVEPGDLIGPAATGKGGEFVGITPILGSSVGNVCQYAASGEVDVAIVYSSDVYRFEGVEVVGTIPADTHRPIIYPAAITADSKYAEECDKFLAWAISDSDALKIWQQWGFTLAA